MTTDLATRDNNNTTFSMVPRTLEEAMKFAEIMAQSDLVPKDYKGKAGNILVAMQKGFEVGLAPMAALETIAVINGRATMFGDGLLAVVQAHPDYEWIDENDSTELQGVCILKRRGHPAHRTVFTLADAKAASLLEKPGPWQQYRKRMLQMRARGFNIRDTFADATKGLVMAEEAMDIPSEVVEGEHPAWRGLKEKLAERAKAEQPEQPALPLQPEEKPLKPFDEALIQLQTHAEIIERAESKDRVMAAMASAKADPIIKGKPDIIAQLSKHASERLAALEKV